jgi:2-octaprenyl-6-methoxyphenol hydroxylase
LDAFGYNIENRHLIDALEERARNLSNLSVIDVETVALTPERHSVAVAVQDGSTYHAQFAIGADGRNSICRAAAGIDLSEREYPQVALTLCLRHRLCGLLAGRSIEPGLGLTCAPEELALILN